jgi:hypothetical protein
LFNQIFSSPECGIITTDRNPESQRERINNLISQLFLFLLITTCAQRIAHAQILHEHFSFTTATRGTASCGLFLFLSFSRECENVYEIFLTAFLIKKEAKWEGKVKSLTHFIYRDTALREHLTYQVNAAIDVL